MTHSEITTKALVPYTPPESTEHKESSHMFLPLCKINGFYASRSTLYYLFLVAFIFVSVFARCVQIHSLSISTAFIEEVGEDFSKAAFQLSFIYKNLNVGIVCLFSAFLAGFTVFSHPITLLSFLRFCYFSCYFFFAGIERAYSLSFLSCLCYIGLFALLMIATTVFFTEASLFYKRYKEGFHNRALTLYILLFIVYLFLYFTVNYFLLNLLFNS